MKKDGIIQIHLDWRGERTHLPRRRQHRTHIFSHAAIAATAAPRRAASTSLLSPGRRASLSPGRNHRASRPHARTSLSSPDRTRISHSRRRASLSRPPHNVWSREDVFFYKRMLAIGALVEKHNPDVIFF